MRRNFWSLLMRRLALGPEQPMLRWRARCPVDGTPLETGFPGSVDAWDQYTWGELLVYKCSNDHYIHVEKIRRADEDIDVPLQRVF